MSMSYRLCPLALLAGAVVAATALSFPAHGASGPTTLAIEGTLRVVVLDRVGPGAHAEYLHTVVTDDGVEIPVDLDEAAPANGRFRGEVIVDGSVASSLRSKGLLPRSGSTIDDDTRAGRVAVAAAEDQTKPLTVASSTIAPALAAAAAPSVHRAYVAKMTDQAPINDTDAVIKAKVNSMLDYWETESSGYITDFAVTGGIVEFDSTLNAPPTVNCGIRTPKWLWNQAVGSFPGVDFELPGNHLIVLVGEECVASDGPTGVASVGSSINDGGYSVVGYDPEVFTTTGVHEIGHNFGLGHANLHGCLVADHCEYLDLYSPMGFSVSGAVFGAPALGSLYRTQLGLASSDEVATVALAAGQPSLTQSVNLNPRSSGSGRRGVLVTDPSTGTTYSIDWRSATARDAGSFYARAYFNEPDPLFPTGVVIERRGASGNTYLMSHPFAGRAHGAFAPGHVFAPSQRLRIAVNAIGASTATVTVQMGAAPTPPAPPAVPKKLSAKAPKITGTARVGKTLKVKVGAWSPRPAYRYQWYAGGKKITTKGTKSSFKLTSKQKGKRITVRVTGTKSGYVTVTKASKSTKKVAKKK